MIAVKNVSGKARIVVAGVGGGGNNAIIRMVEDGVSGVELLGINTEDKAINALLSYNTNVLQIGENLTRGLGAGTKPETGEKAAEESKDAIRDVILSFSGDLALIDVSEAAEYVHSQTGEDSNTIFGSRFDQSEPDTCSVTLIATGIKD